MTTAAARTNIPSSTSYPARRPRLKLLIAIPALNEEQTIGAVIRQAMSARREIVRQTLVTEVEITVVSDGSTDRTVELAAEFGSAINLIVFEKNRGYGAAIMEAWRRSDAELLAFLDADGTCDPSFFTQLCRAIVDNDAEIALGCRMHRQSQMPLVRRLGNILFAGILTALGSTRVRDAASGMRVVRRRALPRLLPLPTGLHFTPAMSARAILASDLRIVEVDMAYHERSGESKLRPIADGLRFLRVILSAAFLYRPSRPLDLLGFGCLLSAVGWTMRLLWQLARYGSLKEWMIHHFVVIQLSLTGLALLVTAGYLGQKAVGITLSAGAPGDRRLNRVIATLLKPSVFWAVLSGLVAVGTVCIAPPALEYVRSVRIDGDRDWPRFIGMSCAYSLAFILITARMVDLTLDLLSERVDYLRAQEQLGDG